MRYKKEVLNHLKERYENHQNKNFYFKSKQLSRVLGISRYTIGKIVMEEVKQKNPNIRMVRYKQHGSTLFKTGFA